MFINSEEELHNFFCLFIVEYGSYFLLHPSTDDEELIYVSKFANFNEDGTHYFLEHPCDLIKYRFSPNDLIPDFLPDDEDPYFTILHRYIRDSFTFEVDSPQTGPFLPKSFSIELLTNSSSMAANYLFLLNQTKKN